MSPSLACTPIALDRRHRTTVKAYAFCTFPPGGAASKIGVRDGVPFRAPIDFLDRPRPFRSLRRPFGTGRIPSDVPCPVTDDPEHRRDGKHRSAYFYLGRTRRREWPR